MRRIFDLQVASVYRGIQPLIQQEIRKKRGKVLDVGCGAMPYRNLFPDTWAYKGIDIDSADDQFGYSEERVVHYDGVTFPVPDGFVDIVFHSEVIEHVLNIKQFLSECRRVLSKDGVMIFTVPFQARYHYIPNDYWRFTPAGLQELLEKSGFVRIRIIPRSTDICVAAYKVLTVGYRLFFSRCWWRVLLAMVFAPVWVVSLIVGQFSLHLDAGSADDCLGYLVTCRKK